MVGAGLAGLDFGTTHEFASACVEPVVHEDITH